MLNLKLSRIHVKFGLTTIILNGKEVKYLIRAQNGLRGTMPIILCDQKWKRFRNHSSNRFTVQLCAHTVAWLYNSVRSCDINGYWKLRFNYLIVRNGSFHEHRIACNN